MGNWIVEIVSILYLLKCSGLGKQHTNNKINIKIRKYRAIYVVSCVSFSKSIIKLKTEDKLENVLIWK